MNVIWIILAVISFIGGQIYLFRCLWKLDEFSQSKTGNDDRSRYPDEDVVE